MWKEERKTERNAKGMRVKEGERGGVFGTRDQRIEWSGSGMRGFGFILGALGTIFVLFVHWILGFATIVVAIILLCVGKKPEWLKKCPKCAEKIKVEAIVCRFCGADVSQVVPEGKHYPGHMEGCRCKKCLAEVESLATKHCGN